MLKLQQRLLPNHLGWPIWRMPSTLSLLALSLYWSSLTMLPERDWRSGEEVVISGQGRTQEGLYVHRHIDLYESLSLKCLAIANLARLVRMPFLASHPFLNLYAREGEALLKAS